MRTDLNHIARKAADRFWQAFADHRFADAAACFPGTIWWFGEAMADKAWQQRASRAHGNASLEVDWVATVSEEVRSAIPAMLTQSIFTIPLTAEDVVCLFDCVRNGDVVVTVGTTVRITGDAPPALIAVFDPRPLRRFCLSQLALAA
jgi:hypothetical protein